MAQAKESPLSKRVALDALRGLRSVQSATSQSMSLLFEDDVSAERFPTYHTVIGGRERATSLTQIRKRVAAAHYADSGAFAEEVLRAFTNALLFSPDPTRHAYIRNAAIELALSFGTGFRPLASRPATDFMSVADVRRCSATMEQLLAHRTTLSADSDAAAGGGGDFMSCAAFFADPVAFHGAAYRVKISEPMSLAALGTALIGLRLPSRAEFARRARLVFENALLFDHEEVHALARSLLLHFNQLWSASEAALAEHLQLLALPPSEEESTCPVFTPTLAELSDFGTFVQHIERTSAFLDAGICKVRMPEGWLAHPPTSDALDAIVIDPPIKQCVGGAKGCFSVALVEEKPLKLREFERLAANEAGIPLPSASLATIERAFWRSLTHTAPPPVYGADVLGSLFGGHRARGWNVDRLESQLLSRIGKIPGVNQAYLYAGMWRSFFALHKEDSDLGSTNYLWHGADKIWYGCGASQSKRVESLMNSLFPDEARKCSEWIRHKNHMVSASVMEKAGIKLTRVRQHANEFVITAPGAYHFGFNCGFNVAEAVNYATAHWLEMQRCAPAKHCRCRADSVNVNLESVMAALRRSERARAAAQKRKAAPRSEAEAGVGGEVDAGASPLKQARSMLMLPPKEDR